MKVLIHECCSIKPEQHLTQIKNKSVSNVTENLKITLFLDHPVNTIEKAWVRAAREKYEENETKSGTWLKKKPLND